MSNWIPQMWFPTKISLSYYDTLQSQIDCGRHSETAMVVTISEVGGICCLWYIAPSLNLCAINCGLLLLKHQTHITVIHFFVSCSLLSEKMTLFRVRLWNNGMRCMSLYILMNSWYGQIASWDIRVLVVFAPNLALCHRHAALLSC